MRAIAWSYWSLFAAFCLADLAFICFLDLSIIFSKGRLYKDFPELIIFVDTCMFFVCIGMGVYRNRFLFRDKRKFLGKSSLVVLVEVVDNMLLKMKDFLNKLLGNDFK